LRDFRQHGQEAVARVRRTQPAAYLKILALLVPREHKVGVIEGTIEPAAATAHAPEPKNRLMLEADTAVGPRERILRKMRPPAGE